MKAPSPKLVELLKRAAELRAGGYSWEAVGRAVGRRPGTCAGWPGLYPEAWGELLRAARRAAALEGCAEAQGALRVLLRADQDKTRLAAAAQLLKPRRPARRSAPAPAPAEREMAAFISQVKGLSDEELERTIRDFLAAGGGAAGVADPAGAA